jgi:UDP-2,3-diacylglucosamine pyrophosphatase LpxH
MQVRPSLSFPPSAIRKTSSPVGLYHHRTIFVSDTHLGTRGAKAALLANFLAHNHCQTLYLVGDIIDGWRLRKSWYWTESHTDVLHEILRKVHDGTRVIYIPGKHDDFFRSYCGLNLAGIEIRSDAIHQGADGKQYLICHGDQFDGIITYAKWLAHLGDRAYNLALSLSIAVNAVRRRFGLPYWSLSGFLKRKVKNAAKFIDDFEHALVREARAQGLDGVICGHIHHADVRMIDGILYANDGDWVDSCTALTEGAGGKLEVLKWTHLAGVPLLADTPPKPSASIAA